MFNFKMDKFDILVIMETNQKNGKQFFGLSEKNQLSNNAFTVEFEVKRFIGKKI